MLACTLSDVPMSYNLPSLTFASSIAQQVVRYRCRKCRQLIATERNVVPQEGVGRRIFRRQQHRQQQQEASSTAAARDADGQGNMEQGAVFLEPISWMADQVVGPVQGKLYCPNCSARLGTFDWSGMPYLQFSSFKGYSACHLSCT